MDTEAHSTILGNAADPAAASLDLVTALLAGPALLNPASAGMVVARLVALDVESGEPLVVLDDEVVALAARTVIDLHRVHIGRQVLLAFEGGRVDLPIVIGVFRGAGWPLESPPAQVSVEMQGRRLIVDAENELTLRCGKASITMTRDGRIELRGTQLVSHADGANRIRGGSVELN
jgi:hypothetical protein